MPDTLCTRGLQLVGCGVDGCGAALLPSLGSIHSGSGTRLQLSVWPIASSCILVDELCENASSSVDGRNKSVAPRCGGVGSAFNGVISQARQSSFLLPGQWQPANRTCQRLQLDRSTSRNPGILRRTAGPAERAKISASCFELLGAFAYALEV